MTQQDNREQQIALYGASLAELVGAVAAGLGISQAKVAALIGVSAPMLSQLVTGHRVKLGNPAAVARLQQLIDSVKQVQAGQLSAAQAIADIEAERPGNVLTRTTQVGRHPAADVQHLMRSVASATDLLDAADRLAEVHPEVAALLRVYGAGRADEAEAHWAAHVGR